MQPDQPTPLMDLIRRYGTARVNNEVVPNDRNAAKLRDLADTIEARLNVDRAAAYQRGLADGRTQATEGCERKWGIGHPNTRHVIRCEGEAHARENAAAAATNGPREPAEQTEAEEGHRG